MTFEVVYSAQIIVDNTKDYSNDKLRKIYKEINNNAYTAEYLLIYNNNIAKYTNIEQLANDAETLAQRISKVMMGKDENIYIDLKKKKISQQKNISGEDFILQQAYKSYDWNLTNEKRIINNLTCFKATTYQIKNDKKIDITAWYCPSIPGNFGPKGFSGLPGLITQLNYYKVVYTIKSIKQSKRKIKFDLEGELISEDQYKQILKDLKEKREKMMSKF
jgi:GLPGLI family protein